MKLTTSQIQRLQEETGAQVVSHDDPVQERLRDEFGDHTFFLNDEGLHLWELIEGEQMMAVQIAAWDSEQKTVLVPHEPKPFKFVLLSDKKDPSS